MTTTKAPPKGWLWLCLALLVGCDHDGAVDGGSGDGGLEGEGEGEGECTPGLVGDPVGCDFQCNDPTAPDFRISHLEWTAPVRFTQVLFRGSTNAALDDFYDEAQWLIDTGADGRFRTGTGQCDPSPQAAAPVQTPRCWFDAADPAPGVGTWSYATAGGDVRLPDSGAIDVDVSLRVVCPAYKGCPGRMCPPCPRTLLPLRSLTLAGFVSHDANCIGSRTNDDILSSEWNTGGVLTAKITVEDAETVELDPPFDGMTLCDLVSGGPAGGAASEGCDDDPDPTSWVHPPDTDVEGEPAWTVAADFAAIGVVIDEP